MHYVYILRSLNFTESYVGSTKDVRRRLNDHNTGKSNHTAKFKPWKVVGYYAFEKAEKAREFEKYLKSSSGKAFTNKRLV